MPASAIVANRFDLAAGIRPRQRRVDETRWRTDRVGRIVDLQGIRVTERDDKEKAAAGQIAGPVHDNRRPEPEKAIGAQVASTRDGPTFSRTSLE